MEVEEFRRILAAGLGRAILYLHDHDDTPYRDVILYACTHGLQFDRQQEGLRSKYLLELIECTDTHVQAWYHDQILEALRRTPTDPNLDADQLFAFAWQYAEAGDADGRETLYGSFAAYVAARPNDARASEGLICLVELDGLEGFLFAAELLGKWLLDDPEVWFSDWPLSRLEDKLGKEVVAATLRQHATESPSIAAYVQHIYGGRETRPGKRANPAEWTYEQMLSRVTEYAQAVPIPRAHSDLQRWGRQASDTDIVRAADELLRETEPTRLYPLVSIFTRRSFPLSPDRLIALACPAPDADYDAQNATLDERLAWWACRSLQNVAHPAVRELALSFMGTQHLVARGTGLLRSNYRDGDHTLIEESLRNVQDDDTFYTIGLDALQICKTRPLPETSDLLTLIYERGLCSHCREWAVELLDRLQALPEWMIREGCFDVNEDIRDRMVKLSRQC